MEIRGKFNTAKVMTDKLDEESYKQILSLCNQEISKDEKIVIMPDVHAGKDNVIGLTMTINNMKISPSLIGSDIGCGVAIGSFELQNKINLEQLDEIVKNSIPYGYFKRQMENYFIKQTDGIFGYNVVSMDYLSSLIFKLSCIKELGSDYLLRVALEGVGTLGGGNHFIELYKQENTNTYYISVHTGSRTLGGVVYKYYQNKSQKHSYTKFLQEREILISDLKQQGREQEIHTLLNEQKQEYLKTHNLDDEIPYLIGKDAENYLHDIQIVQQYAEYNRKIILNIIYNSIQVIMNDNVNVRFMDLVDKPHNYIDTERMILRKGSQSAEKNATALIPINMRDGMLVFITKGLEEWNYSAPHGAGRVLSRGQAKKQLNVEDFKKQMQGIYSSTIGEETLDESPNAYKTLDEILENVKPIILKTIDGEYLLNKTLKPIYNFKGGNEYKKRENKENE